ncbi:MAG: amidohydrolase family protein [Desulfobulbus sp.]
MQLYCAPWVAPVSRPMIAGGAVAVADGRIIETGSAAELRGRYAGAPCINHPDHVLVPALINAHTHLELSHLESLALAPLDTGFTGWIERLITLRASLGATGPLAETAARQTALDQYEQGTSVLADIGNTALGQMLRHSFPGTLLAFREYLGLAGSMLDKNLARLRREPDTVLCSGHAVYSTHPRLLQAIKARATSLGQIFPIHTAEPAAEGELLREGRGEMVDFVRRRGFWDESAVPRVDGGTVRYLYELGLLDPRTLCVHTLHVTDEEMRMLAGEGVQVCLCPGSNRFLRTGVAPVERLLAHGIRPALGTDSLASNPQLSLWEEMRILAEEHPGVDPAAIFAMATRHGAEALGLGHRLGTLDGGKEADILAVALAGEAADAAGVYAHLVRAGSTIRLERILQGEPR